MKNDKILQMIGLAKRAGKAASGAFAAEQAIKQGKACLVIISADASENTKAKFRSMCEYRNIKYIIYADKEELGRCLGQEQRSCAAITDASFAEAILAKSGRLRSME